jgi:hypothetical protein
MFHDFMPDTMFGNRVVTVMLIGHDQTDILANGLANELHHARPVGVLDHPAYDIALSRNRADDCDLSLAASIATLTLVHVFVFLFAADPRLIDFDLAHERVPRRILHRSAKARTHVPSRMVVGCGIFAEHCPMDLERAHALLGNQHEVSDPKPRLYRLLSVLEDGSADDAESIIFAGFAEPIERLVLERIRLLIPASRALHASRPTAHSQKLTASIFIREALIKSI